MKLKYISFANFNVDETNAFLEILMLGNQQIARGKVVEVTNAVAKVRFNHRLKPTTPQPQKT